MHIYTVGCVAITFSNLAINITTNLQNNFQPKQVVDYSWFCQSQLNALLEYHNYHQKEESHNPECYTSYCISFVKKILHVVKFGVVDDMGNLPYIGKLFFIFQIYCLLYYMSHLLKFVSFHHHSYIGKNKSKNIQLTQLGYMPC